VGGFFRTIFGLTTNIPAAPWRNSWIRPECFTLGFISLTENRFYIQVEHWGFEPLPSFYSLPCGLYTACPKICRDSLPSIPALRNP